MRARVTDRPIDVSQLMSAVTQDGHGAVLLFLGTVRDSNDGHRVVGIRYEAYQEMAERVLAEIVSEAEQRTGACDIAVVHRVGDLEVGDASVAIAVATPHRAEAFAASRYVIEEIKKRLPVWKHEKYAEGEPGWVRGVQPGVNASHEQAVVDE